MKYNERRIWSAKVDVLVVLFLLLIVTACSKSNVAQPTSPDPHKAIARSLSIVGIANPENPKVLRVLFYGQSISSTHWTDQAINNLRAAYPNVTFDSRNLALGGFDSGKLERTTERDIAEFYPDLIVFHVYGDHRAYERIIRLFRSKTSADIVVQTDHVTATPEPVCDEGLQLRWSPPPGCTGHIWFKQRNWEDFMSGVWLPTLATRYGLAVEPRRERWDAYLQMRGMKPAELLVDMPHPNEQGWTLMADLFTRWFKALVASSNDNAPPERGVMSFAAPISGSTTSYQFEGNRIELISNGPLNGKVTVTIDGKRPQNLDGCWLDSRVSRLPNVPDWPALSQVKVDPSYHKADTWTLHVTNLNDKQTAFDFTLSSASAGYDGSGKADEPFSSISGLVNIEPIDWTIAYAASVSSKRLPEGYTMSWTRSFVCSDQEAVVLTNGSREQRYLIATGLPNVRHNVKIRIENDASIIKEVRTYMPQLLN